MASFTNEQGSVIAADLIRAIQGNKQYLSDLDGAIGDGDHGINMNKGFSQCEEALEQEPGDLSHSLETLSRILITNIGGSMGPLYGTFFHSLGKPITDKKIIDRETLGLMLRAALEGIQKISTAKVGDKTLIDTLAPAVEAFESAQEEDKDLGECLAEMKSAAEIGRDSTKDLVAKLGRSSRLGERSKGVIDAGAASCHVILKTMADSIQEMIDT